MGGDGERGKAWLRARGASSVSYRNNFLFFGGVGGGQGNWPFTLREHWKITHYF